MKDGNGGLSLRVIGFGAPTDGEYYVGRVLQACASAKGECK